MDNIAKTVHYNGDLKKFNVTFTENKKYNPITRSIEVLTNSEIEARNIISHEFDTFTYNKKLLMSIPSGKRIHIDKVEEIKEEVK